MAFRVARLRLICCFSVEFLLTSPLTLHYRGTWPLLTSQGEDKVLHRFFFSFEFRHGGYIRRE